MNRSLLRRAGLRKPERCRQRKFAKPVTRKPSSTFDVHGFPFAPIRKNSSSRYRRWLIRYSSRYRLELARDRRISSALACTSSAPAYLSSLSLFADKPAALSRPAISALTTRIFSNSFQTRRESLVAVESRRAHEQRCPMLSRAHGLSPTSATRDKGGETRLSSHARLHGENRGDSHDFDLFVR